MFDDFPQKQLEIKADVQQLRTDLLEMETIAERFGQKLTTALVDATVRGKSLNSVFKSLALSMSRMVLKQALKPIGQAFAGAFSSGSITPFAKGGVLNSPVTFPMRNGLGLAGEAGPEAIMPLTRDSSGRLGVRTSKSSSVTINFNITTPDADSFMRSGSQISAMLNRAVSRGARNL